MNRTDLATSSIRDVYQRQQDILVDLEHTVLVSHFGTFSQSLVSSLSESIEELLVSIGDKRIVVKRMFSILIEGLQNLRMHGENDGSNLQTGFLLLSYTNDQYKLILANILMKENSQDISDYIDSINGYTREELKEVYTTILSNEFISQKGGAGLGLITTRMKSGNPLVYEMFDLNEEKELFVLNISLDRVK